MTSSKNKITELFIWIFLPNEVSPVVAGKVRLIDDKFVFNYGKSYLSRRDAISIFTPELPLNESNIYPLDGLSYHGCIRDGSPDAWGRRAIINEKYGVIGKEIDHVELDELSYMLMSGSDRIGALDFQLSSTQYSPRDHINTSLDELINSVDRVHNGIPLTPELAKIIQYGTPIGGARPKALIKSDDKKFIAKFSSSTDVHSVVKGEYIAMTLAKLSGINVANVTLETFDGRDVILVERFDRELTDKGWTRKSIISALTILELDENMARYASYEDLATKIRENFKNSKEELKELFSRLTFNILSGNTDDHARNHASIWDGSSLKLTKAYDICPQNRTGGEASQGMIISNNERTSKLSTCLKHSGIFSLSEDDAINIIINQVKTIGRQWNRVCNEASFSEVDKKLFWGNQFLNSFSYEDLSGKMNVIKKACQDALKEGRVQMDSHNAQSSNSGQL
ncbi:MAG: type II toxin-antitoxin system HipA family toxin [Cycloclasticus sp.]|nr:type II toxin-antitoxin system HipA family toxin [Cycloclasticus sp.]